MVQSNVLVLGGYGFFGRRLAESLQRQSNVKVFVGGRRLDCATRVVEELGHQSTQAVLVDARSPDLAAVLRQHRIDVVVHTAGPFQNQDYRVARAAIASGCDYVDLADDRCFVTGIVTLDAAARAAGVRVISGASSVPALSSAVVDRLASHFDRIDTIRVGISSGARSPGQATLRSILSYCGKSFARLEHGTRSSTHGWQDTIAHRFPAPVGRRLLGSCNVPDLDLLPENYPSVETVTFHGGYGSTAGHLLVWAVSGLVRARLIAHAESLAPALHWLSERLGWLVNDSGGMFVIVHGMAGDRRERRSWHLVALHDHGPFIPCGGAIAVTRKLIDGNIPSGARPCVGIVDTDEYLATLHDLDVEELLG